MKIQGIHLLSTAVDRGLLDMWARAEVTTAAGPASVILSIVFQDEQGERIGDEVYLWTRVGAQAGPGQVYEQICFVPDTAASAEVFAIGRQAPSLRVTAVTWHAVSRWRAATHLFAREPHALLGLLERPAPLGIGRFRRRFRDVQAACAHALNRIETDYATWIRLFDAWRREDFAAAAPISIAYLVMAQGGRRRALRATIRSIEQQYDPPAYAVARGQGARVAAERLLADYIGIVQAGEVLPPHATALAARELDRLGRPEIATADEDQVAFAGRRHSPAFKPVPNDALMLSGTLSRGLWLVRRDTLREHAGSAAEGAEALRLRLWLARRGTGRGGFGARIPFILSHRRPDTSAAPPSVLAGIVDGELARRGAAVEARATWPLTFTLKPGALDETVTVIIPSTLRRPHALGCITAVLENTDYADFELHVAVSQPGPLDPEQLRAVAGIEAHPKAHVTKLDAARFNFSWVNNQIVARTRSDHVLLLNDDVSPINPDWLRWLVAFLRDPAAGIAGGRLLYPDGRVQHGGVTMGLAGLCDHLHRYVPRAEPGYMGRAVLAQELSAVTGACMLVRRRLLEQLGGLDEGYPSAFNDVDLALRVGELGYAVLYVPQAELYHHELQTYGSSHYTGERVAFLDAEVKRLHNRWAQVCAADPFHNPNLSLETGQEWELAFPPRVGPV